MESDSIPRSIIVLMLILLSAFFSLAETSLTHCNRIRIKLLADDGDKRAGRLLGITDRFEHALIAILIGNNLANTACSFAATVMFIDLFGDKGALISTAVITVLIFLFGESIPKNIARMNADTVSLAFSMPLRAVMFLLAPAEFLIMAVADLAKKLIGNKESPTMTEDEFSNLIAAVEEEGILEPDEGLIIRSAIEFGDKTVGEIMRERDEIAALDINSCPEQVRRALIGGRFSRVPVYRDDLDDIVGFIQAKGFFDCLIKGREYRLESHILPVTLLAPDIHLDDAFERMSRRRSHLAIVSEGRKTLGLVTMEDILEEIVGDIFDEFDLEKAPPAAPEAVI